ncbi:ATP-binding protein [Streptomyces sp. NPDC059506]|uniref:ATP-binding protein n=1 Tax=Streptomyces sp. NPDC059506 TaxID=3347751 RepID=UPI0036B45752
MTEQVTEETPVGTLHSLEERRAARSGEPVRLVKGATVPAPAPAPEVADEPGGEAVLRVPLWVRTGRAARAAATHERTRAAGRATVRHGSYVLAGGAIAARRVWDGRTAARYERMIRTAEAAGNHEAVKEWEARGAAYRAARHKRRMELLTAPERLGKNVVVGAAVAEGSLLALGIALAIADNDPALVVAPTLGVIEAIRWVCVFISLVWGPLVTLAPWAALVGLWALGRHRQAAPAWTLPATARRADDAPITPSSVVTALRDLGIAAMSKAIKGMEDGGAGMLSPIVIAGCGVEVDVLLPSGVSTQEVQARRRKLAENLGRHEHEVFITIPAAARTVRLWIADSGALDQPIGPSPLALDPEATANYKTGKAPWGQDLRGDAAALSLYQRHLLVTGLSNQGKTASLRALALWLALDPTVEFRIADLKGAGDWAMFNALATVLIQGPTDEHVIAATEMLEEGVEEMERRLTAPPGTAHPPLVLLVDEAQVAFMCPAVGEDKRPYGGSKATSRYFMAARKIHNQGRAVNVTLWQGTQDPTDQNLPKLVREGAHTRASLVLGTESQARMALGDKAVDGGAAPHLLRQGLDKGTLVVASDGITIPAGQASITVRTHFITDEEAVEIADRAKARRTAVTTRADVAPVQELDPLADIAAVLGDARRMRTQEVLTGLVGRDSRYREWTFTTLTAELDKYDAAPHKSDGHKVVAAEKIARALADRDAE